MAKRTREHDDSVVPAAVNGDVSNKIMKTNGHIDVKTTGPTIQIITGSYERTLHGITASVSGSTSSSWTTQFTDSFLFNAHASSIRCLAVSPLPSSGSSDVQGVLLATGGSDERVNVYSLSTSPVIESPNFPSLPSLGGNKISENPRNRELGTLIHHSSSVSALHFPTRSKLFSASEDNSIAISRIKDLMVVSTIKAPKPKAQGQPSGDTAPVGVTPAGVNDFAIHPSMKLMISVGRGEKCMRLWDLVRGKKAGVLNFDRQILQQIKESKYSSGEGRRIRWNAAGTEFAVSFERGAIVFDAASSKPTCIVLPQPLTKVHQIHYLSTEDQRSLLALSTEDGRVVFYDTAATKASQGEGLPGMPSIAQLGGRVAGVRSRIKDFKVLDITAPDTSVSTIIVTASSDGCIKLWRLKTSDLIAGEDAHPSSVGELVGSCETGSRITCMEAFVMLPASEEEAGQSGFEGLTETEGPSSSDSDEAWL